MPKRILEGVVVSDKGDKTIIVRVERTSCTPLLKKTGAQGRSATTRHDEGNATPNGEKARHRRVRA
jgi:small subunit ribosomal protein S17